MASLAQRIAPDVASSRSRWRPVLAGGLTALLVVAFALTGGISYAARSVQSGTTAVTSLVTGPLDVGGPGKPDKPDKPDKPEQSQQGGGGTQTQGAGAQSENGSGGGDKVTICHYPPGNEDNPQTITIDESAWPTPHEEHGDTLGPCDEVSPPDDQYEDKVLICHVPPGNEGNANTIRVSENAVPAHLAHGDTEGPCPEDD